MKNNLKKVISSIAALAMALSCFTAFAADFSDVDASYTYKNAIDELVALDVINGYEDGTFKPENEITRAEVTKMVVAALGKSYVQAAESSSATSNFTDVAAANHWATGYINVGVAQGFINGMGDGTFSPDTNVTYAQIVKMLVSVLGYTSAAEANGGYPNGYLQIGASIGVCAGVSASQDQAVTRGQVAQLIDNALATPIVAVTGWTTNIYGNPVAETEIMDGTGDSEKYQTLLTENHNAYKVKGRVSATHAQGSVDVDEVEFTIEYTDNYDGDKIDAKKYTGTEQVEVVKFGNTNAPELLFTYAEALIQLDEDDEATLLSIFPYGKNDIVELNADDFASLDSTAIDFNISATSTKTKSYKLADTVGFYVNGVEITKSLSDAVNAYIVGNKIGKVTLIDTPQAGTSSKDGKYDYIMVTMQKCAIVDSTNVSGTVQKIYFDAQETGLDASVSLDTDDEDFIFEITKDGAPLAFEEIKEDDVLLIKYDVTDKLKNSKFVYIDVCDTVISGKVTEAKNDDGWSYVVDGTEYSFIDDSYNVLTTGNEYDLYLDSVGRIVKFEESSSSANYAVIDRVYYDNNSGETKARIIKADGTRASYIIKSNDEVVAIQKLAYGTAVNDGTLLDVKYRVISYKLNTKNEIHTVTPVNGYDNLGNVVALADTKAEYKESSTKVGSARMTDTTTVIDLSGIAGLAKTSNYSASDIKAASVDSFTDGEEYTVLYGAKNNDGNYKIVIILEGNASIGVATNFAVIDSVSTAEYEADGSERTTITVFSADSMDEKVTLYLDEDVTNENQIKALTRGDVVVYGTTGEGLVDEINLLWDNDASSAMTIDQLKYASINYGFNTSLDPKGKIPYINSGVAKWDNSDLTTSNGYARVGAGIILDRQDRNITFGLIDSSLKSQGANVFDISLDSDANVYVLDYNEQNKSTSDRLTVGGTSSIVKTSVPSIAIDKSGAENVYDWNLYKTANDGYEYVNYAFFKTVDGDITDILVIIPADAK